MPYSDLRGLSSNVYVKVRALSHINCYSDASDYDVWMWLALEKSDMFQNKWSAWTKAYSAGSKLREHVAELQKFSGDLEKLKQLASVNRHEVKALLPEVAQCIHSILQNARKGSVQYTIRCLFAVGKVVKQHSSLLPELAKGPCKELVVSMLQAASEDERTYKNSFTLSQICVAQYNLHISCEQFWQKMPENCIDRWDHRTACSVVYAYGKLHEVKAVHPASDVLRVLQHKIVVHHATGWDAQGVSNVACAQGAAKVQNKSELTGTRSQDTMHWC
jgi:hypothetical protein